MVVRIRDSEFIALGLDLAGFKPWNTYKVKKNVERFKGLYGASPPKSCEEIWVDLQMATEEEGRIDSDANVCHFLLALRKSHR
jgi:hypothetical protein